MANYFEKGIDNFKNRLTKDFIKWFKSILFKRKEGQFSLLKDSECFALLAKIYGYKVARVNYLNQTIRCFTGIVLKDNYKELLLNYIELHVNQESSDSDNDGGKAVKGPNDLNGAKGGKNIL